MRRIQIALLVVGVLGLAAIVREVGADAVLECFRRLSWVLPLLLVVPGLVTQTIEAFAWRFAFRRDVVATRQLFVVRLAGEALNMTTPTASIGGDGVKAWLLGDRVRLREVVPSLVISKTSDASAQWLLLLLGLALAWRLPQLDPRMLRGMLALLFVEGVAVVGFVLFQIKGGVARGGTLLSRLGIMRRASTGNATLQVDRALARYYRHRRGRFALSVLCNLASFLLGVVDIAILVYVLAGPTPLAPLLVINSIVTAISFLGFFVPSQIAVREGAYVAAFVALGMDPAVGLAVALARRVLDLSWAGIGFLVLAGYRRAEARK
jgi:uncharacterized protein (TIRG00374 family)